MTRPMMSLSEPLPPQHEQRSDYRAMAFCILAVLCATIGGCVYSWWWS